MPDLASQVWTAEAKTVLLGPVMAWTGRTDAHSQAHPSRQPTCKGFFIGFWPVEVSLRDVGSIDAHLPNLASWHQLVLLVENAHLQGISQAGSVPAPQH